MIRALAFGTIGFDGLMVMATVLGAVDTSDPVVGALVSYGVAAPVVYILYRQADAAKKDRDIQVAAAQRERDEAVTIARAEVAEVRSKNEALTDRLLEQQAASLPVLTEAVAVIKATAVRGH